MDDLDYETYKEMKLSKGSFHRYGKKCNKCGNFYLCTCQVNLNDWVKTITPKKLTMDVKIKNCPHNCINNPNCLDCIDFNKFRMEV